MGAVLDAIGEGLFNAFEMAWEVWWALVLGFALSGVVQAWVTRGAMERAMGGRSLAATAKATGLGAASSSCSYAAVAIAKSTFQKGAGLPPALAFMFASTNLVFELGLVIWLFLGPVFTAAEFVGGFLLIGLMWAMVRWTVSRQEEEAIRAHAEQAQTGHQHTISGGERQSWRERLTSVRAWSDVAHNFRGDVQMLWKEILAGFVIAGFVALLPRSFFRAIFLTDAPAVVQTIENVLLGPLIAVLSFVCSVGNIPLAAVLWAGGISFSGVIAFIFADLITLPLILIYRKYYGTRFALKLVAMMLAAIIVSAIAVDLLFSALGLVPDERPRIEEITDRGIELNYTAVLNVLFTVAAATLLWLTVRRGATDPVCGMRVDRFQAEHRTEHEGHEVVFCSQDCKEAFEDDPARYADGLGRTLGRRLGGLLGRRDGREHERA